MRSIRGELALTQRDQGDFGRGEDATDQDEQDEQDEVEEVWVSIRTVHPRTCSLVNG